MYLAILFKHARHFVASGIIVFSVHSVFGQTSALETDPSTTYTLTQGDVRTKIRIASSYVDNDAMEKGATEGAYFHIRMQWPSLSGVQAGDNGDVLRIQLMQGQAENMHAMIEGLKNTNWIPYAESNAPAGFTAYLDKHEADAITRKKIPGYQFLVPNDPHDARRIYIQCPAFINGATEAYGCEAHTYLGHLIYGQYSFSYSQLAEWKKIDAAVRSVFETIYKAGND